MSSRMRMTCGLSYWMISAVSLFFRWMMVKVEYATPRTEQTGSVAAMVDTHSSSGRPSASMVEIILEVRVERIDAFTPLPRPSESTMTIEFSSGSTMSTWSPQSCSPTWLMLL